LSAALLVFPAAAGPAAAQTGEPGEPPCQDVRAAELDVGLRADPPDPAVGDLVELDAQITNMTAGPAGIPLFRLTGAEPLFTIEGQENSYPLVEFAHYRLRAMQPGEAALQLSVNFETAVGCSDLPVFVFPSISSPPYVIAVRGAAATASTTPTATPLPPPALPAGAAARAQVTPGRTSAASPRP
jgi:hypothetical protein